jgi:hypothetical protein
MLDEVVDGRGMMCRSRERGGGQSVLSWRSGEDLPGLVLISSPLDMVCSRALIGPMIGWVLAGAYRP